MNTLSSGKLKQDFIRFCIPCVCNLLFFSIYSVVDGIFVSRFVGSFALAAVNLSMPYTGLLFCIGITLATGSGTLIANALGRKDHSRADFIFSENLFVTGIVGLLIGGSALLFLKPLCVFFGGDEDTLSLLMTYLGTLAPFSIFVIMEYSLEVLVKINGSPRFSMVTVLCSSTLNIALDALFIIPCKMGVFGAALATGISQMFATVVFLLRIIRGKNSLFGYHRFKWDLGLYKKLVPLGAADGALEICSAIMLWLYNRLVSAAYGAQGLAAYTVINYVNVVVLNTAIGITQGMEPLVSYHFGAKDREKCKKLYTYALFTEAMFGILIVAFLEIKSDLIIRIFFPVTTPEGQAAFGMLGKYALSFLLTGFNVLTAGYMTSLQRPKNALLISLSRALFAHAAVLLLLYYLFGQNAMWWAALLAEGITAILSLSYMKKISA